MIGKKTRMSDGDLESSGLCRTWCSSQLPMNATYCREQSRTHHDESRQQRLSGRITGIGRLNQAQSQLISVDDRSLPTTATAQYDKPIRDVQSPNVELHAPPPLPPSSKAMHFRTPYASLSRWRKILWQIRVRPVACSCIPTSYVGSKVHSLLEDRLSRKRLW